MFCAEGMFMNASEPSAAQTLSLPSFFPFLTRCPHRPLSRPHVAASAGAERGIPGS